MRKITIILFLFGLFFRISAPAYSQNADIDLLRKMNNPSPFLRNYAVVLSTTAPYALIAIPVSMGTAALIKKDDELLKNALYAGASIAVGTAFTYGLKYSVCRLRPYDRYPGMLDVPYPESSPSFPSAHASAAFAAATSLSLKYPKWYVIAPSYFWACSVGYSRMNLGVHYPTDVLAGALLGAGSAYLAYRANEWFWKKHENKKIIWY